MVRPLHLPSTLFPTGVVVRGLRIESEPADVLGALAGRADLGGIALPESLANAVPKRRVEFVAGRSCARAALRECLPSVAEHSVAVGPSREPIWPEGAVGSIAHTSGYVVAAVARGTVLRALGVDVERWMDEGAPGRIGGHVALGGELDTLATRTGWPRAKVLTLVFSAKETVFKCLYPEVKRYFGFHDARIEAIVPERPESGAFVARLTTDLEHLPAGFTMEGRFECLDDVIVTTLARSY